MFSTRIHYKFIAALIVISFICNGLQHNAWAHLLVLPKPGEQVGLSPKDSPVLLKGIKLDLKNPLTFDFILDPGSKGASSSEAKSESSLAKESNKLIKYFLASLTVPENDLWVNLSPYEKDRVIPDSFGQTEMGRDLLAEDYLLKQITSSLMYPESETGKAFWHKVYAAAAQAGLSNIPVNTFNKVWILPDKAVVYENAKAGTAFIVEAKLKVMLEEDYMAFSKQRKNAAEAQESHVMGTAIIRDVILPILEKEINEGQNFSRLRQVYHSLILAAWYKKRLNSSILSQVYIDRNKVVGTEYTGSVAPDASPEMTSDADRIYARYIQAFKKGVYNLIREEKDPVTGQPLPRKYFAGGLHMRMDNAMTITDHLPGSVDANGRGHLVVHADMAMATPRSARMPSVYAYPRPKLDNDGAVRHPYSGEIVDKNDLPGSDDRAMITSATNMDRAKSQRALAEWVTSYLGTNADAPMTDWTEDDWGRWRSALLVQADQMRINGHFKRAAEFYFHKNKMDSLAAAEGGLQSKDLIAIAARLHKFTSTMQGRYSPELTFNEGGLSIDVVMRIAGLSDFGLEKVLLKSQIYGNGVPRDPKNDAFRAQLRANDFSDPQYNINFLKIYFSEFGIDPARDFIELIPSIGIKGENDVEAAATQLRNEAFKLFFLLMEKQQAMANPTKENEEKRYLERIIAGGKTFVFLLKPQKDSDVKEVITLRLNESGDVILTGNQYVEGESLEHWMDDQWAQSDGDTLLFRLREFVGIQKLWRDREGLVDPKVHFSDVMILPSGEMLLVDDSQLKHVDQVGYEEKRTYILSLVQLILGHSFRPDDPEIWTKAKIELYRNQKGRSPEFERILAVLEESYENPHEEFMPLVNRVLDFTVDVVEAGKAQKQFGVILRNILNGSIPDLERFNFSELNDEDWQQIVGAFYESVLERFGFGVIDDKFNRSLVRFGNSEQMRSFYEANGSLTLDDVALIFQQLHSISLGAQRFGLPDFYFDHLNLVELLSSYGISFADYYDLLERLGWVGEAWDNIPADEQIQAELAAWTFRGFDLDNVAMTKNVFRYFGISTGDFINIFTANIALGLSRENKSYFDFIRDKELRARVLDASADRFKNHMRNDLVDLSIINRLFAKNKYRMGQIIENQPMFFRVPVRSIKDNDPGVLQVNIFRNVDSFNDFIKFLKRDEGLFISRIIDPQKSTFRQDYFDVTAITGGSRMRNMPESQRKSVNDKLTEVMSKMKAQNLIDDGSSGKIMVMGDSRRLGEFLARERAKDPGNVALKYIADNFEKGVKVHYIIHITQEPHVGALRLHDLVATTWNPGQTRPRLRYLSHMIDLTGNIMKRGLFPGIATKNNNHTWWGMGQAGSDMAMEDGRLKFTHVYHVVPQRSDTDDTIRFIETVLYVLFGLHLSEMNYAQDTKMLSAEQISARGIKVDKAWSILRQNIEKGMANEELRGNLETVQRMLDFMYPYFHLDKKAALPDFLKSFQAEFGPTLQALTRNADRAAISDPKNAATTGGIDLSAGQLPLDVRQKEGAIRIDGSPELLRRLQGMVGLTPRISQMEPLADLRAFLASPPG